MHWTSSAVIFNCGLESIFALEESPHNNNEIWVGSDDVLIHLTRDGGTTCQNITPNKIGIKKN